MKDIEQRARELEAKVWAAGSVEERRRVLEEHLRSAEPRSTAEAKHGIMCGCMSCAPQTTALAFKFADERLEEHGEPVINDTDVRMMVANAYVAGVLACRADVEATNRRSDAPPVECSICLEMGSPRDPVCPGCIQIACDAMKTARSPNAPPGPYVHVPQAEYDELRLTLAAQATELHELRSRPDVQPYAGDWSAKTCKHCDVLHPAHHCAVKTNPEEHALRSDKAIPLIVNERQAAEHLGPAQARELGKVGMVPPTSKAEAAFLSAYAHFLRCSWDDLSTSEADAVREGCIALFEQVKARFKEARARSSETAQPREELEGALEDARVAIHHGFYSVAIDHIDTAMRIVTSIGESPKTRDHAPAFLPSAERLDGASESPPPAGASRQAGTTSACSEFRGIFTCEHCNMSRAAHNMSDTNDSQRQSKEGVTK